ncbi:hypothetical protein [Gimesia fumaroli]|uniref:Carboxypeptidase regulatory-like domain-containing protein n=1 Tax=Gimesia fumaroli TaxID=2527976 RepID=A0A518I8D7_9PLAN|nr:hypothetical protein [Gimesia fumaroli]QDV49373.1 hypothetical protein Enr17x_13900 [Gimesia fumaroli]
MLTKNQFHILVSGLIILVTTGCGGSSGLEFSTSQVQGTVSYQGKPLESGKIRFIPDGEVVNGQVAGKAIFADIKDGKYTVSAEDGATVGKNRVEIKSYRGSGKMVVSSGGEGQKVEEVVQFIPAQYNTETTLSVEIKKGDNVLDFDLK